MIRSHKKTEYRFVPQSQLSEPEDKQTAFWLKDRTQEMHDENLLKASRENVFEKSQSEQLRWFEREIFLQKCDRIDNYVNSEGEPGTPEDFWDDPALVAVQKEVMREIDKDEYGKSDRGLTEAEKKT